ncbi:MAG: glutamine synthetase, partial [Alphaproteobacteria bacterium]|nr:glutamine synthetase [Alphaproteobacteria bacterium]
ELAADFSARPYEEQPGSGMHIHLTLHDAQGDNVLYKKDQNISPEMRHAIGGLIATLRESMLWFAPHEESYRRFVPKLNAPTHICWGGNNRTAALRLPDDISGYKHIEHRVPGADADPHAVIAASLAGVHHGLMNKLEPGEQIFGNAFLDMYALESLPKTLAEAKGAYEVGTVIKKCFT